MIIDEHIASDGCPCQTALERVADHLVLRTSSGERYRLSDAVVLKVMRHYGRALDDGVLVDGEKLALAGGAVLTRFSFRARVDASARDYLAVREVDREVIATLSQGVAAALEYLARRLADERH